MKTHKRKSRSRTIPARGAGFAAPHGSVSVSQLKPLIEESEKWAKEYIKREARYRARGAHREAAHFEDLICAHQNFAGSLRQIVWAAEKRQPTLNDALCDGGGGKR